MSDDRAASADFPLDRPSAARMYDYFLGGHHHFAIDRQAAAAAIRANPDVPLIARANRGFLRRVVTCLSAHGIEQFLDIGSGIPTVGNVHAVAQGMSPAARVVYVDHDPIAVEHSRALLREMPTVTAIQGDVRQPEQILTDPQVRQLLDWSKPIAVLLLAILHFVADDAEADHGVRVLQDAMAPGSYLAISHGTQEERPPELYQQVRQVYARSPTPLISRTRAQITHFFGGFELVPPGLVFVPAWRPEGPDDLLLDEPWRAAFFGGVGRKP